MNILRDTIEHPAAWKGADFTSKADLTVRFEPNHLDEIDAAVRYATAAGQTIETLQQTHFPLQETAQLLSEVREVLRDGCGIVVMSGIDVERYTQDEIEMIYWGLGTYLGDGVSQSVLGDRLGHVRDVTAVDPHARAYRNNQELTPHTDQSDIVGLMCLRTARSGGVSIATSALAVHNELVRRFPDFLEPLHLGFYYHRRGEQLPGEAPVTPYRVPVFSWFGEQLSCRYVRSYIETAARENGRPLSALETDALNCLERLTYELAFEFSLEPGDIYLINNYTVLHARTAFENWPEPERSRHLLRLWLNADGWRSLDPRLDAARHGIAQQPGKTPSFEGAFGQGRIATK